MSPLSDAINGPSDASKNWPLNLVNLDKLLMSYTFVQVHKQNLKMKMKKLKKKMEIKGKVFDLETFQDKKKIFEQVILHFDSFN